jgi:CHAT domain-containing protein
LIKLQEKDRESQALVRAYRLLSYGLQAGGKADREAGSIMIYGLHEAGNIFRALGMEELHLWAVYFAAVQTMDIMGDTLTSIESAQYIQKAARRARFEELELAGLLLEGTALSEPSSRLPQTTVTVHLENAHDVLERSSQMAAEQGFAYQQAWAANRRGMVFGRQGRKEQALEQYLLALDLALPLGDASLTNQVRSDAADASEQLGDTHSAVTLLQEMNQQLSDAGELEKLSKSLYEQGRLLVSNYKFPEAARALEQALAIERELGSTAQEGPVGLMLAKARYNQGHMDRALGLLQEAITKTRPVEFRDELTEGLSIAANIHRFRGEYGLVKVRRDQQSELAKSPRDRAYLQFDQALDGADRSDSNPSQGADLFAKSLQLSREAGLTDLQHLSQLHFCVRKPTGGGVDCSRRALQSAYRSLIKSRVPRLSTEARYLWALYLAKTGQSEDAIREMSKLNEDAKFFRSQLSGVLGAWYWENRAGLSQAYMTMLLRDPDYVARGTIDGRRSFAALDQLRTHSGQTVQMSQEPVAAGLQDQYQQLRSLIAERQQGAGITDGSEIESKIAEITSRLKTDEPEEDSYVVIEQQLAALSGSEAVLTYYFDDDVVHAWVGHRDGIDLVRITRGEDVAWSLVRAAQIFDVGNHDQINQTLNRLGKFLIAPVLHRLKPRIYFIPAGPLSGMPLDAVRVNGSYLAMDHEVVNIISTSVLLNKEPRIQLAQINQFFLGGNPQITPEVVPEFTGNAQEMNAVADLFVGPSLHMVQGNALTGDEFNDDRFRQADVIHLASPAVIDLASPSRSRIYLSDNRTAPGGEYLTPGTLESWRLDAGLFVMSTSSMVGTNPHSFANQTPLLTELLDAGADSVLCSLWLNEDTAVASFMSDFYTNLSSTASPVTSLYRIKRQYLSDPSLSADDGSTLRIWAGFQYYRN